MKKTVHRAPRLRTTDKIFQPLHNSLPLPFRPKTQVGLCKKPNNNLGWVAKEQLFRPECRSLRHWSQLPSIVWEETCLTPKTVVDVFSGVPRRQQTSLPHQEKAKESRLKGPQHCPSFYPFPITSFFCLWTNITWRKSLTQVRSFSYAPAPKTDGAITLGTPLNFHLSSLYFNFLHYITVIKIVLKISWNIRLLLKISKKINPSPLNSYGLYIFVLLVIQQGKAFRLHTLSGFEHFMCLTHSFNKSELIAIYFNN